MSPSHHHVDIKIARIYLRFSNDEQDLARQARIEQSARAAGFYVAGVYREKALGARLDRRELVRMVSDMQSGEVIVAERIELISRLRLMEAEQLVGTIRAMGAKLSVHGLVDLSDLAAATDDLARLVLESGQELLLKLVLHTARDSHETRRKRQRQVVQLVKAFGRYAGRTPDTATHTRIVTLRSSGQTVKRTAELTGCSPSYVKRIWAIHLRISAVDDI